MRGTGRLFKGMTLVEKQAFYQ
ncbi:hypothetical protein AX774_g1572, partial [Zancudomyces culisetae]